MGVMNETNAMAHLRQGVEPAETPDVDGWMAYASSQLASLDDEFPEPPSTEEAELSVPDATSTAALRSAVSDVTVMMVDDEQMMTDVTQTYLEEAGYQSFIGVNDPLQALDIMRTHRPGLLLLDLMMPGMSGFEVLEAMRADPVLRYIPVIVLTAANDTATKLKALDMGATEFLAKPVDASELKIRVRNSLVFKVYQDRLANDDLLTGLPNRRVFVESFREALGTAAADQKQLALLQVNLDRFRQVNDTLGNAVGDRLLTAVAERLRHCTRRESGGARGGRSDALRLSRLGGDEFALLMPRILAPEAAARVARQVLRAFAQPFDIDGKDLFITPSIGIAVYPSDGPDDETLLRNAGAAMAHAKSTGRNNFQFYSEELNNVSVERLVLETELRRVVARNELVLHYQPKIDVLTGSVVGCEALLRWQHPEMGLVPPGKFIPIAEETGLIVAIGEWVIHKACEQIQLWRNAGLGEVKVAVNVSRHGMMSGALMSVVANAMVHNNIRQGQLVLELTESMLMDRVENTRKVLLALRELGAELSIDDFGTGYSSMSYLKQFPVQELKIDRSFITGTPEDKTDVAIVRALVVLGHSLNMRVVAEGVETEGQRQVLEELGCDWFQGFLVSKALPAQDFAALYKERNRLTTVRLR
jgi:diguanylate cyclase